MVKVEMRSRSCRILHPKYVLNYSAQTRKTIWVKFECVGHHSLLAVFRIGYLRKSQTSAQSAPIDFCS